jgi:hypothetical protein
VAIPQEEYDKLYRPNLTGCSDGGCIIKKPNGGMVTNGGCHCEKELMRSEIGRKAVMTMRWLRSNLQSELKHTR